MKFESEYPIHDSQEHWERHQALRETLKKHWGIDISAEFDLSLLKEAREQLRIEAIREERKLLNASFGTHREWIVIGIIAIAIIVII